MVHVSVLGRQFAVKERVFWLHFDARVLVELTPRQAVDLLYQLADEAKFVVHPKNGFPAQRGARARWRRLRRAVQRGWTRAR